MHLWTRSTASVLRQFSSITGRRLTSSNGVKSTVNAVSAMLQTALGNTPRQETVQVPGDVLRDALSLTLDDYHELKDLTVKVSGHDFRVHKLVLSAMSPPLAHMISSTGGGDSTGTVSEIVLPDEDPEHFQVFLRLMYGMPATLSVSNAIPVFHLAETYELPAIARYCAVFLTEHITVDNCCSIAHGVMPSSTGPLGQQVLRQCQEVLTDNFEDVWLKADFMHLPRSVLLEVIQSSHLNVTVEDTVLGAVLRWGSVNCPEGDVSDFMPHVRWPLMEGSSLLLLEERPPALLQNEVFRELLMEAYRFKSCSDDKVRKQLVNTRTSPRGTLPTSG